jgi:hypothetical protein
MPSLFWSIEISAGTRLRLGEASGEHSPDISGLLREPHIRTGCNRARTGAENLSQVGLFHGHPPLDSLEQDGAAALVCGKKMRVWGR